MLPDECQSVVIVMCEAPAQVDEDQSRSDLVVLNEDQPSSSARSMSSNLKRFLPTLCALLLAAGGAATHLSAAAPTHALLLLFHSRQITRDWCGSMSLQLRHRKPLLALTPTFSSRCTTHWPPETFAIQQSPRSCFHKGHPCTVRSATSAYTPRHEVWCWRPPDSTSAGGHAPCAGIRSSELEAY